MGHARTAKRAKVAKAATFSQQHVSCVKTLQGKTPKRCLAAVLLFFTFHFWLELARSGGYRVAKEQGLAGDGTRGGAALCPDRRGGGIVWSPRATFGGLVLSRKRHPIPDPP